MYLASVNYQVWDVTESDFVIFDPTKLTSQDKANKQCNTMALNTIYNAIDSKVFEQIKYCERASDWRKYMRAHQWSRVQICIFSKIT